MLRLGLCAALLGGCHFTAPTPVAYVSHGPAHGQAVNPIVALPARCGAATMGCMPGYLLMVASASRMALELGGGVLVDSELINAELQLRITRTGAARTGEEPREGPPVRSAAGLRGDLDEVERKEVEVEVTGQTWLELPLLEQRRLLEDMGVGGVLESSVSLGVPHGPSGQRTVTVRVALRRMADDLLVWESACGVETGDFHSEPQAIELATRCALESATLW